jgi:S1-C subfamily serine protease
MSLSSRSVIFVAFVLFVPILYSLCYYDHGYAFGIDELKIKNISLGNSVTNSTNQSISNGNATNFSSDAFDSFNLEQQDELLSNLYNKTQRSVVSITTKINPMLVGQNTTSNISNISSSSDPLIDIPFAEGSGFVYDKDGHIITNYHVLRGGTSVDVRFLDGNSYSATLVGKDPYSDLAVLQVDPSALYRENLVPLPLASSSSLKVGHHVVAIGNPLGYSGTMTEGIVSQLNIVLTDRESGVYLPQIIQVDIPITHGSSGGPLLNLEGQVVGLTKGGTKEATFINFAIPSETVSKIVPKLINEGSYNHTWMGISGVDLAPDLAKTMGLSDAKGYLVSYVAPNSPAEIAGISKGHDQNRMILYGRDYGVNVDADIIIAVDNTPVRQQADLLNYIENKSPGDKVSLKIVRNKNIMNVMVQLGTRPLLT